MKRLFFAFATFFLILNTGNFARCDTNYDRISNRINMLCESPNVMPLPSGKSVEGREIRAFVITDLSVSANNKTRVFICSGQHGNEINPIYAILSFCEKLLETPGSNTLKNSIIIVVPMVNPDGVANVTRTNSRHIDINRDWVSLKSSEAVFVNYIIKMMKPQVLLDAHEWLGYSPIPDNSIEIAQGTNKTQKGAMLALGSQMSCNSELTLIQCSEFAKLDLFHRYYTSKGYAAYLIETSCHRTYKNKELAYSTVIRTVLDTTIHNQSIRQELSPHSKWFNMAKVSRYVEFDNGITKTKVESIPIIPVCIIAAVYIYFMVLTKSKRRKQMKMNTIPVRAYRPSRPDIDLRRINTNQKLNEVRNSLKFI